MKSLNTLRHYGCRTLTALVTLVCFVFTQCVWADNLYFVHTDHLGTPVVITDSTQATVWQGDKTPFGETTTTTNQIAFNVRFPGQYYDAESGLHYNYFRDYDPATGRYVQSDPIGLEGGLNTYAYVGGNPLTYTDPTGEEAITASASAGAGTAAAGGTSAGALVGRLLGMGIGTALYPNSLGNDDQFYPDPAICSTASMAGSGRWSCTASCNVTVIDRALDGKVPERVTGSASGKTQPDACAEAKRAATQSAPRGTYARHCQCSCSKS